MNEEPGTDVGPGVGRFLRLDLCKMRKYKLDPCVVKGKNFQILPCLYLESVLKAGTIKKGTRENREEECLEFSWGRLS